MDIIAIQLAGPSGVCQWRPGDGDAGQGAVWQLRPRAQRAGAGTMLAPVNTHYCQVVKFIFELMYVCVTHLHNDAHLRSQMKGGPLPPANRPKL